MFFKNRRAARATKQAATDEQDFYALLLEDHDAPLRVFAMSISPALQGSWESKRTCPLYQYGYTGTMTWELLRTLVDIFRSGMYRNEPHLHELVRRCTESAIVDGAATSPLYTAPRPGVA